MTKDQLAYLADLEQTAREFCERENRTLRKAIDQATTAYLRAKPGEDAGAIMFRILMDATEAKQNE